MLDHGIVKGLLEFCDDSLLPDSERKLPQPLDYLKAQLPPKDGIPGKRVFIGEYGFPADRFASRDGETLSRRMMRAGLKDGRQPQVFG
jgi:hypothetical protein